MTGMLQVPYRTQPNCCGLDMEVKIFVKDKALVAKHVKYLNSICAPFDSCSGPDLYYYEVVECGRRMLLTGVLVFIAPHTATQVAMACIFAFASILGFEIMRPHMDPTDAWLYRLVSRFNCLPFFCIFRVGGQDLFSEVCLRKPKRARLVMTIGLC